MSDLATFYNALNIEQGAARVTSPATPAFQALKLIRPTISNQEDNSNFGFQLLTYESCLEYSIQMVAFDAKTATYRSAFSPPAQNCLVKPAFSWMAIPENGFNFQPVMKLPGGNYIVQWGSEKFVTDIVVDRDNGRIQSAKFGENFLRGKRWFCPGSLEKCSEISSNFFHARNVNLRYL